MNTTKKTGKGFTIIEVVLVLAIAGLIFLMVFVALPALQSGQRDTARKQDVGNLGTAITNYSTANRGSLPPVSIPTSSSNLGTPGNGFLSSISNNIDTVNVRNYSAKPQASDAVLDVYLKARCGDVDGSDKTYVNLTPGTARQYVMVTLLETAGGTAFCQNS